MRKNDVANWYKNKHQGQNIPRWELERKWRMYLYEEEQMRLAEAISAKQSQASTAAGGGPKGPESTPESELVTETGQAIVTETGAYLVTS